MKGLGEKNTKTLSQVVPHAAISMMAIDKQTG
jgi:hypothetical protein